MSRSTNAYYREYRSRNLGKRRAIERRSKWKELGLNPEIAAAVRDAGKACSFCHTASELCVDHDHTTGAIRGVLCRACNSALGRFKDDPALLEAAVAYLRPPVFAGFDWK